MGLMTNLVISPLFAANCKNARLCVALHVFGIKCLNTVILFAIFCLYFVDMNVNEHLPAFADLRMTFDTAMV